MKKERYENKENWDWEDQFWQKREIIYPLPYVCMCPIHSNTSFDNIFPCLGIKCLLIFPHFYTKCPKFKLSQPGQYNNS